MAEITYTPDPVDLERLELDLNDLVLAFDTIHREYAGLLTAGWKQSILDVDAVDTTRYYYSVAARKSVDVFDGPDTKLFVIDTASDPLSFYSDIVEQGRRDTAKYKARFPAGKSLDIQHNEDALEMVATKWLDIFLHG